MNQTDATLAARKEAKTNNLQMAVVNAPIEHAEDSTGPFGYCPTSAVSTLYRFGKIVEVIEPGAPDPAGLFATYCPEDDKLRLYCGRVPRAEYERLRAEGWTATPKQDCNFVAVWTPTRYATALEFCEIVLDEDQGPDERAADRAERFGGYRDKRTAEATGHADAYDSGPLAHGYQSQARADRAAARHDRIGTRAADQWSKADYWTRRTEGVISHSLHLSSPAVRMGRIKTIEAELRRMEKGLSEYAAEWQRWSDVEAITDREQQTELAKRLAYLDHGYHYAHPVTGKPEQSLERLMAPRDPETDGAPISGELAVRLWLDRHHEPKAETEWTAHLKLRLAYEHQMLEAQGGRAAFVEMEPGGWVGAHQVQKVNKSPVTGRTVSVNVHAPTRANYDRKGVAYGPENPRPLTVHVINVERLAESAYRPPTDEERAAFHDQKKAEKANRPPSNKPPLINPTDADAERLQEVWNKRAREKHCAANLRQYSRDYAEQFKPATVTRIKQATYSANSKGAYARAETRALHADCELADRVSNMYCAEETKRRERIGPALCEIRQTHGGGDWYTPRSVIVLTDKPQKPLPAGVWTQRADHPPIVQALLNIAETLA